MKTMTAGLKSSDKMFTELEEKRMKFEEQQRKEDQEFQLKMMQLLQQRYGGSKQFLLSVWLSTSTTFTWPAL